MKIGCEVNMSREEAPFLYEGGGLYALIRQAGYEWTDTSWDSEVAVSPGEDGPAAKPPAPPVGTLPVADSWWYTGTIARAQEIRAHGLELVCYHSDLLSPELPPHANGERQKLHMQCARASGCSLFLVHSKWVDYKPFDFSSAREWKEYLDFDVTNLLAVAAGCEANGLRLVIENNPFFPKEYYVELLGEVPEEKAGMCLDVGHANLQSAGYETGLADYIHAVGGRIEHLHLHGNDGAKDVHLPVLAPGGSVDWKACFRALKDVSYSGVVHEELVPMTGADLVRWALEDRGCGPVRAVWESV